MSRESVKKTLRKLVESKTPTRVTDALREGCHGFFISTPDFLIAARQVKKNPPELNIFPKRGRAMRITLAPLDSDHIRIGVANLNLEPIMRPPAGRKEMARRKSQALNFETRIRVMPPERSPNPMLDPLRVENAVIGKNGFVHSLEVDAIDGRRRNFPPIGQQDPELGVLASAAAKKILKVFNS